MARPKRMGAYNALDDLLPGPAWDPNPAEPDETPAIPRRPRLQPVPDPPRSGRERGPNALDELLPGPEGTGALEDLLPGPSAPPSRRMAAVPGGRGVAGRHLGVWNPLDGPPPAAPEPPPRTPAKARVSFRLPADLVETARDAVAHLAGTADRTTLTALTERALRVELARLAITHNGGRPFPARDP
ncbi:MAG TPA: hypothetical protein VFX88_00765 [Actinomycetota bacterium]|nr:hypothetical protein [Actinomycetota bacterium]